MRKFRWFFVLLALVAVSAFSTVLSVQVEQLLDGVQEVQAASRDYPDPRLQHTLLQTVLWKDIPWENHLLFSVPSTGSVHTALIFITGDYGIEEELGDILYSLSSTRGVFASVLFDVPNQPLFKGWREDDLIAETFLRFLETGDSSWPLLVPMVASVVQAMNWMEQQYGIQRFVLSGGSKRGWTTFLTATVDDRVKGIVPMAFDFLNFPEQLQLQDAYYAGPSYKIAPYVRRGLTELFTLPESESLLQIVDPYLSRQALDLPKIMVVGSNDPYWHLLSWQPYLDQLPGYSHMLYVPNEGHGGEVFRPLLAMQAMLDAVENQQTLPSFRNTWLADGLELLPLEGGAPYKALGVTLWVASSDAMDFRSARWEPIPATKVRQENGDVLFRASFPPFSATFLGVFAEVLFQHQQGGSSLYLSTPSRVFSQEDLMPSHSQGE